MDQINSLGSTLLNYSLFFIRWTILIYGGFWVIKSFTNHNREKMLQDFLTTIIAWAIIKFLPAALNLIDSVMK